MAGERRVVVRARAALEVGLFLVLVGVALASCGAPAGPDARVTAGGAVVRRVRFEEDRVTCYTYQGNGLSCLRDAP